MTVWALAMFKRDWAVQSNNRSDGDKNGEVALQTFIGSPIGLSEVCVEFRPGDGEITKIPIPLHPRPSPSWQQISSKPLTS